MHKYINILIVSVSFILAVLMCPKEIFSKNMDTSDVECQNLSFDELPSVVISYRLISSRHNDFQCIFFENNNILSQLAKELDKLPDGIATKLSLTNMAFILQNSNGQFAGFTRTKNQTLENAKIPYESFLFITTPIYSFDNRILAIISTVSPDQTTIISIDNKLKAVLLYDSFCKNNINNLKDIKGSRFIGSIHSVKVIKPGVFDLQERLEPGARGFVSPYQYRIFHIDITKGKFEFSWKP